MNHVMGCGDAKGECQEDVPDFLKNRAMKCGFDNFKLHTILGNSMVNSKKFRIIFARCNNLGFHLKYGLVSPYWFQTGHSIAFSPKFKSILTCRNID